jgi:hypothetical protein
MKKRIVMTGLLLTMKLLVFSQNSSVAGFDFYKYNGDSRFASDTNGRISFRLYYGKAERENRYGWAYVYIIHKNGGKWWWNEAKKKHGDRKYPALAYSKELYNDMSQIKDYDGYAFFTDKKYLKPFASGAEDGSTIVDYYPTYPCTIILYERKSGTIDWIEIERKTFITEQEHSMLKWESNFIKKKIAESNLPK